MSGRSGRDWWQGSDDYRRPPQQYPQAHTPRPPYGPGGNPGREDPKKNSRSFGERVNTTQGILAIIVSLITLGGSAALAVKHFTSHKGPAAPSAHGISVSQARGALLTSSDLASMDKNLISSDVAFPSYGSCNFKVQPAIDVDRKFTDTGLALSDAVEIYGSSTTAHMAFAEDARQIACSFTTQYSISDISSQLHGICSESAAWRITDATSSATISNYAGVVRCEQAVAIFTVSTVQGSSFDNENSFLTGMETAVAKIQELPLTGT